MDQIPLDMPNKTKIAPSAVVSYQTTLTPAQVLKKMQEALPNTKIVGISKSEALPYMYVLQLENGSIAYTDLNGKYYFLGIIFDTYTGKALDNQLTGTYNGDSK